jgi:hypothetical protein
MHCRRCLIHQLDKEQRMGMTRKHGGQQQGAQDHAEGQHGDKTRRHIAKAWNHPLTDGSAGGANEEVPRTNPGPQYDPSVDAAHAPPRNSHIFTGRTQHDDADLNAEKTRLAQATERDHQIAEGELAHRSARASAKRKS